MHREDLRQNLKRNKVWFSNNCVEGKKLMVDLHWHDAFEVLYVRRGIARQQINVDTFVIVPGDVVIIRAGDVHLSECISESGCDIDYVQFTSDILPDLEQRIGMISSRVIRCADSKISDVFDNLRRTKDSREQGKEFFLVGFIYMLCGILVNVSRVEQKSYSLLIDKVCQYLEENTDIRLETVSSHFNYSMEHVSRSFHKELGISYREYCSAVKMKKAARLLRNEDISTREIALTLGYSDESSFIRAFKRSYGITPKAFRRKRFVLSAGDEGGRLL